jgi:hypothetical protein
MLLTRSTLLALLLTACRAPRATPPPEAPDVASIRATVTELYAAFCFDAHAEPDWAGQRRLTLQGARFVAPIRPGATPVVEDTETFLAGFRESVVDGPFTSTGLHERIIGLRIDTFGAIAHALVAFEGFRPGEEEAATRGLDSLQLVRDGDRWRLVSFTTQYERDDLALPARYVR